MDHRVNPKDKNHDIMALLEAIHGDVAYAKAFALMLQDQIPDLEQPDSCAVSKILEKVSNK